MECTAIALNEYLDRWLDTAAKPKLREKSYRSYDSLLRRSGSPDIALAHINKSADKRKAWEDVMWSLINTREFLFRH